MKRGEERRGEERRREEGYRLEWGRAWLCSTFLHDLPPSRVPTSSSLQPALCVDGTGLRLSGAGVWCTGPLFNITLSCCHTDCQSRPDVAQKVCHGESMPPDVSSMCVINFTDFTAVVVKWKAIWSKEVEGSERIYFLILFVLNNMEQ